MQILGPVPLGDSLWDKTIRSSIIASIKLLFLIRLLISFSLLSFVLYTLPYEQRILFLHMLLTYSQICWKHSLSFT